MYPRVPNKRGGDNNQGGVGNGFGIKIMGGWNNLGGGCLEKLKIFVFLGKHVFLYIYVNSDVTDTFTFEFWVCRMHFLRLFLAFIQKSCLLSFHFPKINKGGLE